MAEKIKNQKSKVNTEVKGSKVSKTKAVKEKVVSAKASSVASAAKKKTIEKKEAGITIDVFDVKGKAKEQMDLPKKMFGAAINEVLLAQAVRVYLVNQRHGSAVTKTRGQVTGSTRKIYRQKGTGRARHGGIRAPIFVHGGIAHGPKLKDYELSMPKKMKRNALFSALSARMQDKAIIIIAGLEQIEQKTKKMAEVLNHLQLLDRKTKLLLVTDKKHDNIVRAGRNITGVTITAIDRLNTYEVLDNRHLLFMKEAIPVMEKIFGKKEL